jgi:BA14K-like protein
MISLRVSSTAAVMALVLAMAAPGTSFAQGIGRGAPHGGAHMGGGAPAAHFGGGWHGGGGGWHGGYRHGGGFIPGAVAGALIGGAIASQSYGYYGGPGYYDDPGSYYDDQYYDDGAVAVAPVGDDAVTYCMQTYRSYDPASGTYLGFDGLRHPCP